MARPQHWHDPNFRSFSKTERSRVTLLTSGLPRPILHLVARVVDLADIKFEILPEPDNESLQVGREFGNRGQCNPTYFTVGNLVKHLIYLRDTLGLPTERIIKEFAFVTAGGCGPCRMGMYATEYRKALRDAGFQGFRVLLFTRSGDVHDVLMDGLKLSLKDIIRFFAAIMVGDIINTINLRRRPLEIHMGISDQLTKEAREEVEKGIQNNQWISGLIAARRKLKLIKTKNESKPVIHIMGEFWAKTTDGEGNYHLFRFIEKEGGIVSNETVTDWLLHQLWRARWKSEEVKSNRFNPTSLKIFLVETLIRVFFKFFCIILGEEIKLSDHGKLAKLAAPHFDLHVDGGEDHMEVAHHLHIAKEKLADLIISVKPFTCLSSSGVSDGVQSKISELYPDVEFLSVETNGDSATNFYSRIQMAMQKL